MFVCYLIRLRSIVKYAMPHWYLTQPELIWPSDELKINQWKHGWENVDLPTITILHLLPKILHFLPIILHLLPIILHCLPIILHLLLIILHLLPIILQLLPIITNFPFNLLPIILHLLSIIFHLLPIIFSIFNIHQWC